LASFSHKFTKNHAKEFYDRCYLDYSQKNLALHLWCRTRSLLFDFFFVIIELILGKEMKV